MTWTESRSVICPHLRCRMVVPIRPEQTAEQAIATHQMIHHGMRRKERL